LSKGETEEKSVVRTIRFTKSSAHSLEKEAAETGMTVNALVNSITRQHYEWDKKAFETGFTSIHKSVLKALLNEVDDKTLTRIGQEVLPASFEDMASYWFQDSSPDSILNAVRMRFKFDPLTRTEVTKKGDEYTVVLRHDLGPKWSVLAEATARALTRKNFHTEPHITRGDSVITTRFRADSKKSPG